MGVRRVARFESVTRHLNSLQRSRTRGSAESGTNAGPIGRGRIASTEPHSWECGENIRVGSPSVRHAIASTEPHSWECGEASISPLLRPT